MKYKVCESRGVFFNDSVGVLNEFLFCLLVPLSVFEVIRRVHDEKLGDKMLRVFRC